MKTKKALDPSQAILQAILDAEEDRKKNPPPPPREEPLPDLKPKPHLVAFIDILGFGREIEAAKSESDFQRIYKKLHFVQEAFQNVSVAKDPDQARINFEYGRKVLALSDAVVVAITANCPAGAMMGGYDLFGDAISDIIIAQTRCACKGIFLRGGISHGSFFYDENKDILLSPALARAYDLESNYADYPVIIVPDRTRRAIFNVQKKRFYAPGADPTPAYFALHDKTWKSKGDEPLFFLDYARVMVNEWHQGWDAQDKRKYDEARKRHDLKRAQELVNRTAMKNAAYFLKWHRRHVEEGYLTASSESVRRKYRWLMRYHNQSFRHDLPHVRQQHIDLRKFRAR